MFSIVIYSTINSPTVKIARCTAEVKKILDSLENYTIFCVYDSNDNNVTINFLDK